MDQLKAMLPAIKQHSFWGLCVGILAVSIASWWTSTSALSTQEKTRKSQIQTAFTGVEGLRSQQPEHPNDSVAKGMEGVLARFSQEVGAGWQAQYDHQATILVWPASFDQEFHDAVNKLRPIEAIPVTSSGQIEIKHDIPIHLRQQYRNYIEVDLPALAKTIGTEWRATSKGTGNDGGAAGMSSPAGGGLGSPPGYGGETGTRPALEDTSIVLWAQTSQQEIMKTHFAFTGRTENPTTLEVLYAQEDLWVLQNIMDIIKNSNGDAETRHDAAIKEIHFVRVGRSALGMAGAVAAVGQAAAQGGGMEGMGMGMGVGTGATGAPPAVGPPGGGAAGMPMPTQGGASGSPPGAAGAMPGMGGGESSTALSDPADGRYVDEQYQPLKATRLRGSLTSRDPNDALLAVAKRMPVRIRFKIDQRRLNRVLAECGNSRLPIEIRQVRINRPPAASGGSGGGAAGAGGGFDAPAADMPGMAMGGTGGTGFGSPPGLGGAEGMGGMFGGGRPAAGSVADASADPNLIDVELYGIVYIYNPVNKSQLGLPDAPVTAMSPALPVTPAPATVAPPVTSGAAIPAATVNSVAGS